MYDSGEGLRSAGRMMSMLPADDNTTAFRLALTRVRKLLSDCLSGMSADVGWLRRGLAQVQTDPTGEAERKLALGWLAWREGDWAVAESSLASGGREPPVEEKEQGAHALRSPLLDPVWSAYWGARVRLLQGHAEALPEYEAALKRLGGSPQATAWYVDLLWRAGRTDRAEQVWKSVRANKRVAACEEGQILEARLALRKGEYAVGERLLQEAAPRNGVVQVERQLLLAWALASQRKSDQVLETFARAAEGPYPAVAILEWRHALGARLDGESLAGVAPAVWQDYIDGQEARAVGRMEEAIPHYRATLATPTVQPFAAHALSCLGESDPRESPPGLFFAVRARALQAVARFCRRESGPGEFLEALDQAARAGVEIASYESYRRLARQLQDRTLEIAEASSAARRNTLRIALEVATRLTPEEQQPLLAAWAEDDVAKEAPFRLALGRQVLRLALGRRDRALLDLARSLLPAETLAGADVLFENAANNLDETPVSVLWHAAKEQGVKKIHQRSFEGIYRSFCQAILLVEAAGLADLPSVVGLLTDLDSWRQFRSAPPRFVVAALAAVVSAKPTYASWSRALPAWLALWKLEALGEGGALLAGVAGMSSGQAAAGVDPEAWFLHQAARALLREDAPVALAFVRRVSDSHAILPALDRRAQATHLACCLGYDQPGLLTDFIDLLREQSGGPLLLEAAAHGEINAVHQHLAALAERANLPGRLLHHLALIETRLAQRHEADDPLLSTLHARRAWGAWLGFLASVDAPSPEARGLVLGHLFARHRTRVNDHLSRDELGPARSHWHLVMQLPDLARERAPSLAEDLAAHVERFRDELATEYLLTTREAMRFGDIAEGFRLNYERGLSLLGQSLALDRDNLRLLTAYAETCVEWFFDLYQLHDPRLFTEVERLLEPAERLAELVRDSESEVSARSTLSDFWKFRGFAANDPTRKANFYRESLHLNPGNDNVRDLLARLEGNEDE